MSNESKAFPSKRVLVIPTNRPDRLAEFFAAWAGKGGWDRVIVIEDAPQRSGGVTADYHYSHAEIATILGPDAWIISKGDSACRCFGFLAAWWLGATEVLTLDDDCFPHPDKYHVGNAGYSLSLFDHHLVCMTHVKFAPSQYALPAGYPVRTRGLPYRNRGEIEMAANMGGWSGSGDWDSLTELTTRLEYFLPQPGTKVFPHGQYFPVCGMNLCIKRVALPLFYFPLMGEGQPYRRFDDIWAGVIAKKIADHLGWHFSVGEPFVEHRRASDPFVNLVKEAPGIAANETFWEVVDGLQLYACPKGEEWLSMGNMGLQLLNLRNVGEYITRLGEALQVWAGLFEECPKHWQPPAEPGSEKPEWWRKIHGEVAP